VIIENGKCKSAPIEWFFPEKGSFAIGKKVCAVCVVQQECLDFAVESKIRHGVWGGKTARERYGIGKT
jgi:WhiB family redox-sensing transcriptional regulator